MFGQIFKTETSPSWLQVHRCSVKSVCLFLLDFYQHEHIFSIFIVLSPPEEELDQEGGHEYHNLSDVLITQEEV